MALDPEWSVPNSSRVLAVLLAMCASLPAPLALAQNPGAISAATLQRLQELLVSSPLLEPTMGVVEQAQYVASAQEALSQVPGSKPSGIESPTDATAAVESALALASSAVVVELVSEPPGAVVSYRRLIDSDAALLQATTNDTISVAPALYLFMAANPRSGQTDSLRVACATQCRVKFVFPP